MQLLPSILFGISASLDSLLVGIGYGLRCVRIRLWQNLTIGLISLLGTSLSVFLGSRLLPLLPSFLACCIGSLVLILLGVYYIAKWIFSIMQSHRKKSGQNGELTETSARKQLPGLTAWETFFLSLTLSANNIGIGLSASMAGLHLLPAAAATFSCSVLFLLAGNRMGRCRLLQFIGKAADPISGLLLMGLGVLQLAL